ncbi:uncharacterized protein LOC120354249 [Nilaparvata lugens]|uniref:uncharacterized protein LOC120354249 n=1 Tax=Nilaparvata lugens TaxID=108931 RepID=UPI00193D54F2|nr:uncharacterized protein LOC120354249 [Nilaparvata lugens]
MDISVTPVQSNERARKPKKSPLQWKKAKLKTERYKPKSMPDKPTCGHSSQSFQCCSLDMCDLKKFHSLFYKKTEKEYQDHFVLKYVEIVNVRRRRPNQRKNQNEVSKYKKQMRSTRYFVLNKKKERVPVCLNAFIGILGISRFRVNNITKTFHEQGFITEKRGGFKRTAEFAPKKINVMKFIEKLQCIESHYCRKESNRKYLSSDLSIKKLFMMYSAENGNVPVKESYFRNIFNTNYNLGFRSPRTDVCSTCLCLQEKIKAESDPGKKSNLLIEKRVHKLRAKAFYNKLQDTDENLLILSFDCQKNLPIPKLPDQSTIIQDKFMYRIFQL